MKDRPRDHLDEVFDKFSEKGECAYCGDITNCYPEPFGQEPACKSCWDLIVGGEDEG